MTHEALHLPELPAGLALEPAPVQLLGRAAELDQEIAREIFWLDLAALFPPEANQGTLVLAHDRSRVGAADVRPSNAYSFLCRHPRLPCETLQKTKLHKPRWSSSLTL